MITVTTETKAELSTDKGRILGFVKSSEPGKISVAVPGDRAVMTPRQARLFAEWLRSEADKVERQTNAPASGWRTAEAERQAQIRRGLGGNSVRTF